jgi:hypothetical protein
VGAGMTRAAASAGDSARTPEAANPAHAASRAAHVEISRKPGIRILWPSPFSGIAALRPPTGELREAAL